MADRSSIEWTQATWNPTTGCDRTSAGCDNCYALTLAKRLKAMGNPKYQEDGSPRTSGPGFGLTLHEDQLQLPHRWARPRVVFVNSMSDLFHPSVPDEFLEEVFTVMAGTPRHTYQVLTKRSSRLMTWGKQRRWPENVWMGVSVESDRYTFRVDHLRQVPAAVRFISAEPLLGPLPSLDLEGIDWLIAGGESGHHARPVHPTWVLDLRERCLELGTAFFFKQWGNWAPTEGSDVSVTVDGELVRDPEVVGVPGAPVPVRRLARAAAGRMLDGRTWDQMPTATSRMEVR
ncbi:MAG: phage Gp37/Gp68 family protein [Actinomycetota bacterium]|nr:phage Gp37/Gp68 family protein [Actinomycetota bacterium]